MTAPALCLQGSSSPRNGTRVQKSNGRAHGAHAAARIGGYKKRLAH
jgi:hypothetical protein